MFPLFLLLFIAFPIAEIALLISVGREIGVGLTLLIVIGTAIVGTTLLRTQGFGVLARVNETMAKGQMPVVPVMEGMFLLVAGAFLLTPGLITDTIGMILLVPPFRLAIARFVLARMLKSGVVVWQTSMDASEDSFDLGEDDLGPSGRARRADLGDLGDNVIEGEFERVDDPSDDRGGRS